MYDPALNEEVDSQTPDVPPEVEAFVETPARSYASEFLSDVTQLYLNDIGANPLLTAEEEAALARRVRKDDFEARQIMDEDYDSVIIFTSRNERWLEKQVVGLERNDIDNFL